MLFNPRTYDPVQFDEPTRRLLRATVDWFETRGKKALIDTYVDRAWYGDFLEFAAKEGLFAEFLTPASAADTDSKRWDTARIFTASSCRTVSGSTGSRSHAARACRPGSAGE